MVEPGHPQLFTIAPHHAFADALAAGLIARFGQDRLALAHGIVILPNNRAQRAITDAFVRRAGGGLLLPRLVAIGDPELDDRLGLLLDPIVEEGDPIPPAIEPVARRMILARLISEARRDAGEPVGAAEAVRLAADLARTLDQLLVEEIAPVRLGEAVAPELSGHWQHSLALFETILSRWPAELERRGLIDLADRRNRLMDRTAQAWRTAPPQGFVAAAGVTTSAPAIARLLRATSRLPDGMVILPGLDLAMPQEEWDTLGPLERDGDGDRPASIETHPQFHLKRLLDRMGVARGEVRRWRWGGGQARASVRSRAIGNAMTPARFSGKWQLLPPADRRLTGVRAAELGSPAEEAQAIAVALREAVETPGRTAALVTPDRALARRVSAHLARWGIAADDSAGVPLSSTPPGTLLIGLAEAAAEGFAPVPLLAVLKHPLVRAGEERLQWLEGARRLDLALRGPRPPVGLDGLSRYLREGEGREQPIRARAQDWWEAAAAPLRPLEQAGDTLAARIAALREAATALAGDRVWSGTDGRAVADLIAAIEAAAPDGPATTDAASFPLLIRHMMEPVAVRPPQGGHPRISIWGLIEAQLQHGDLMILGGLNEGVWPSAPAPDPWLAPRIRRTLGLPGLERRIGLAAHDFAMALGAPAVLVTRARRDARAPAVASRFWLRLEAMTGGITRARAYQAWAQALDRPADVAPADRPAPRPPAADRPNRIAVTKLDRLKADPFAFYADAMLRLRALDPVDADPSPAWRGSAVHAVFEAWMKEDGCDPAKLRARAERMLADTAAHPVLRALWSPRLLEAIDWVAETMKANLADGRAPVAAELDGATALGGIELYGKVDRIDRLPDGRLAIIDYKTGQPPSKAQVEEGFAMQLGLLGLIAGRGGFRDIEGDPAAFEYWSLASKKGSLGYIQSPVGPKGFAPDEFLARSAAALIDAAERWLIGDEPFTAKLHPEYSPYGDYDQLMRLEEWYGRAEEAE